MTPERVMPWLLRAAGLFVGVCAAAFVLLVLGSAPADAEATDPASDPSLAAAVTGILQPAEDALGLDAGRIANVDISHGVRSLEGAALGGPLEGTGALLPGTVVLDDTLDAARTVLDTTAGAPRAVLELADTATTGVVPPAGPSAVALHDRLFVVGASTSDGQPSAGPLTAGAEPGLLGDGSPTAGRDLTRFGSSILDAAWATATWWPSPLTPEAPWFPAAAPSVPVPPVATAGPSTMSTGQVTASTSSGDGPGGSHPFTGTLPAEGVLASLVLLFLACQLSRALRSPVFLPLVPPD